MNGMRNSVAGVLCGIAAVCLATVSVGAADTDELISVIRSVKSEGQGNEAAGRAVAALSSGSVDVLPEILAGFDGASSLAANYLRAAAETIADRQSEDGKRLPARRLEQLVKDGTQDPRARRLAYELLLRADSSAEGRIIPGLLLDPSPEFRRDAVQRLIDQAGKEKGPTALTTYRTALSGATDEDQVKSITAALKELGETVNLVEHFGFLTEWKVIGPFDNRKLVGFDKVYAPETELKLDSELDGQEGKVAWGDISTKDDFGIIDIARSIAPHKGAVMYLTTNFQADRNRDVELRFGTPNAWKVWVNGKLLFGRDEYHRGMAIDQYAVPVRVKTGQNVILLKLCQNEQKDSWAQRYQIQMRVCDSSGIAVRSVAARAADTETRFVSTGDAK